MSKYGKLDLLPIKCFYLVFSSRKRQRRLIQTKVYFLKKALPKYAQPNLL